jgi:hypothetical protein
MRDNSRELNIRLALIAAGALLQLGAVVLLFFFGPRGSCLAPLLFTPLLVFIAFVPLKRKTKVY